MAEGGRKRPLPPSGEVRHCGGSFAVLPIAIEAGEDAGRATIPAAAIQDLATTSFGANEGSNQRHADEDASSGADGLRSASCHGLSSSASSAPEAARPAQADGEQEQDAAAKDGLAAPAAMTQTMLEERTRRMVLKEPGKVFASDIDMLAKEPTTGLVITLQAAIKAVYKARSKAEKAAMWGRVSQEETLGYVLADVLGYPLLDAGKARDLGDIARKRSNAADLQEKADVKVARRLPTGETREKAIVEATSAVYSVVMEDLPLPAAGNRRRLAPSIVRALPPVPVSAADPVRAKEPAPKHGPSSIRFTDRMAKRRKQLRREYCNASCTCAEAGEPFHNVQAGVKSRDFEEHSMFCRMWHCYTYEAFPECCEVIRGDTAEAMHIGGPCWCIDKVFLDDFEEENSENARYVRGHVDEYGNMDRPGRYGGALSCDCCCEYGRYVPMCPYREHAVTGELRGDDVYEMRGEKRGEWRDAERVPVWKGGVFGIYPLVPEV